MLKKTITKKRRSFKRKLNPEKKSFIPLSRPLRNSKSAWKDNDATWGFPHRSFFSTSSSNLIHRAFSFQRNSFVSVVVSSSNSTKP